MKIALFVGCVAAALAIVVADDDKGKDISKRAFFPSPSGLGLGSSSSISATAAESERDAAQREASKYLNINAAQNGGYPGFGASGIQPGMGGGFGWGGGGSSMSATAAESEREAAQREASKYLNINAAQNGGYNGFVPSGFQPGMGGGFGWGGGGSSISATAAESEREAAQREASKYLNINAQNGGYPGFGPSGLQPGIGLNGGNIFGGLGGNGMLLPGGSLGGNSNLHLTEASKNSEAYQKSSDSYKQLIANSNPGMSGGGYFPNAGGAIYPYNGGRGIYSGGFPSGASMRPASLLPDVSNIWSRPSVYQPSMLDNGQSSVQIAQGSSESSQSSRDQEQYFNMQQSNSGGLYPQYPPAPQPIYPPTPVYPPVYPPIYPVPQPSIQILPVPTPAVDHQIHFYPMPAPAQIVQPYQYPTIVTRPTPGPCYLVKYCPQQ